MQAMQPVHMQQLSKLPRTLEEAEMKSGSNVWCNATEGLSAEYNVYSSNEKAVHAKDPAHFLADRPQVQKFFKSLQR